MPINMTRELMKFFVGEILGREITPADYRSRHMRSAKILLTEMKYSFNDVCGALMSLRDREASHFGYDSAGRLPQRVDGMEVLWHYGEPPLIERWLTPPPIPPVYSCDYDKWVQSWGHRAIARNVWDGIYLRQDPRAAREWLLPVIGDRCYERSVEQWLALMKTSQRNGQSYNILPAARR